MRFIIYLLISLFLISCQNMKATLRVPSSTPNVVYYGLESVDLGLIREWTQGLVFGEASKAILMDRTISELILENFNTSKDCNQFIAGVLGLGLNKRYANFESYQKLAAGLYTVRKAIRSNEKYGAIYRREAMLALSVLAEETLYASYNIFPNQSFMRFDYANINFSQCKGASSKLNNIPICSGDVIVSKGSAGSSSFIARIADYPGNFSHSVIPFINTKGEILMIEAEIEDGLKLRTPKADYIDSKKSKLFVYRAKNPATVKAAKTASQKMYSLILKLVAPNDPTKTTSIDYDFSMDANDSNKMFCSEIAYYSYAQIPTAALDNPYAQKYWSQVADPSRRDFLSKFLNSTLSFPAPSDIDMNPNYEVIGMQFVTSKLSNDRMMVALIDTMFLVLRDNKEQVNASLNALGKLGSQIATTEEITKNLKMLEMSGVKISPAMYEKVKTVPKNISYKQLIFFSFLNDMLAPKIAAQLMAQEKALLAQGQVLDLASMRAAIYVQVKNEIENFANTILKIIK
jgi:hypothetical protein